MPHSYDQRKKSIGAKRLQRMRVLSALVEKGREEQVPDMGPFLAAVFRLVNPDSIAREVAHELENGSATAKRNWSLALMKLLQQYHASIGDQSDVDLKGLTDDDLKRIIAGKVHV